MTARSTSDGHRIHHHNGWRYDDTGMLVGKRRRGARCAGTEMGAYGCSVSLGMPHWCTKEVFVDKCLAKEIMMLWDHGVKTIASCCGHGHVMPMVMVEDDDIPKMRDLNYGRFPGGLANMFTAKTKVEYQR